MRILVCSDVPSAAQKIACLLEEKGYSVGTECDPAAARSGCGGYDAAVLVLSASSAWDEVAHFFSLDTSLGVLALLRECAREEGERTFAGLGIPILPLNAGSKTFLFALEFAAKSNERLRSMRDENVRLKESIGDLKLVDRAKCALIQYLNMTESDAHRFIEKQAMNKRLSKREIALQILSAYES